MATGKKSVSTVDMVDPFGDGSGIALYKFDGDATDESGVYNGTATNVTYETGKFGQCIKPNSTSSVASLSVINFNTPTTLSFWSKGSNMISNDRSGVAYGTFFFNQSQSYFAMYSTNTAYASIVCSITDIPYEPLIWKHYSFVINYPSVKVYIDGALVRIGTMSSNVTTSNYSLGFWNINGSNQAITSDSVIDQFRVFNRAITETEITALYNEVLDTYVPYVPPQGFFNDGTEVAHYAFDGDATDSTGNYDGTASNVTYDAGKFGSCGVFNGSSSKVKEYLLPTMSQFSVSIWFNPTKVTNPLISTQHASPWTFYFKINASGNIEGYAGITTLDNTDKTSNTVVLNSWNNFTFTYNGTSTILYLNNIQTNIGGIANVLWVGGQSTRIGAFGNLDTETGFFSGSIDQVRIFNRALTATEVTALYNEGQ